ncbi:hypothetical protein HDU97_009519, partial [Phlyctochytrium planicorne]
MVNLRASPTPWDGGDDELSQTMKAQDTSFGAKDKGFDGLDGMESVSTEKNSEVPTSTNLWSVITMGYLNRTMKIASQRQLEFEDLPLLSKKDHIETLVESFEPFENKIQEHLARKKMDPSSPSNVKLMPVVAGFGRIHISFFLFSKLINVLSSLYIPFVLKALIVFLQKKRFEERTPEEGTTGNAMAEVSLSLMHGLMISMANETTTELPAVANEQLHSDSEEFQAVNWVPFLDTGVGLCIWMLVLMMLRGISDIVSQEMSLRFQISGSTALGTIAYRKSLKLSHSASREYDNAVLLSMINVECHEVISLIVEGIECIILPLHLVLSLVALISLLGYSVYPSAIVLAGSIIIITAVSSVINYSSKAYRESDDTRIGAIWELIMGIKAVKMESKEFARSHKARQSRNTQMKSVRRVGVALTVMVTFMTVPSILMPIASFVAYALNNGEIDAAIVFPAVMLFEPLLDPVLNVPN